MTNALSRPAEEALATFKHHDGLARYNARQAEKAMDLFLSLVAQQDGGERIRRVPRCVAVWADWLAENGPATRQTITEATGVKFTERGTPHTVKWSLRDDASPDISPDTITRFLGHKEPGEGRGAPPVIYALWSQRYDVRPLFGVGPERPDPTALASTTTMLDVPKSVGPLMAEHADQLEADLVGAMQEPVLDDQAVEPLLGVIHPPDEADGTWGEIAWDVAEDMGELTIDDLNNGVVVPTVTKGTDPAPPTFNWEGAEDWPITIDEALADSGFWPSPDGQWIWASTTEGEPEVDDG